MEAYIHRNNSKYLTFMWLWLWAQHLKYVTSSSVFVTKLSILVTVESIKYLSSMQGTRALRHVHEVRRERLPSFVQQELVKTLQPNMTKLKSFKMH